ncbi:uncharacterized protein MEPE_06613 [Melanopsichium pennsylvanicum]|uniref:Uncharacterized protein n=1 Tax=Melanopsichium pennsylvanicum TaxID=63383 RepID=A0AAJ5C8D9_9BASI|nr:uncharacterized protein MEPE_06613 [Melanopsichium pennsylvanicum]
MWDVVDGTNAPAVYDEGVGRDMEGCVGLVEATGLLVLEFLSPRCKREEMDGPGMRHEVKRQDRRRQYCSEPTWLLLPAEFAKDIFNGAKHFGPVPLSHLNRNRRCSAQKNVFESRQSSLRHAVVLSDQCWLGSSEFRPSEIPCNWIACRTRLCNSIINHQATYGSFCNPNFGHIWTVQQSNIRMHANSGQNWAPLTGVAGSMHGPWQPTELMQDDMVNVKAVGSRYRGRLQPGWRLRVRRGRRRGDTGGRGSEHTTALL